MTIDRVRKQTASGLRLLADLLPERSGGGRIARALLEHAAATLAPQPAIEVAATRASSPARPAPARPVEAPAPAPSPSHQGVPTIDARSLREALEQAAPPMLLDVREPQETVHGIIPGAKLIPMQGVLAAIGELRQGERSIVVYCAHGVRSRNVVTHLRDRGVEAVSLTGGIEAWRAEGGAISSPT